MEPTANGASAQVHRAAVGPAAAGLADISRRVEQGVKEVLAAQLQASHVITTQVRNHDPLRDRRVDELLRNVMSELHEWVPASRRGGPSAAAPSPGGRHRAPAPADERVATASTARAVAGMGGDRGRDHRRHQGLGGPDTPSWRSTW